PPTSPLKGEALVARIRDLGEQLDAPRTRQQGLHPDLTLTGMYNVLEKLRSGQTLTAKERTIHEHGLVSVLRQLHDELDAAVLDAYGWSDLLPLLQVAQGNSTHSVAPAMAGAQLQSMPRKELDSGLRRNDEQKTGAGGEGRADGGRASTPPAGASVACPELVEGLSANGVRDSAADAQRAFDEAILERLVALNAERAAEEARGVVRWLRPEFQHPTAEATPQQIEIETGGTPAVTPPPVAGKRQAWPSEAVDQVRAVTGILAASAAPLSADEIAAHFTARGAWKKRLPPMLEMMTALGRAREHAGRYSAL
ncbi:MAG: hypothetical protein ACREP2_06400, partial [Rhodanobacteraceae bacterium]